jgi:hypothetical protein
MMEEARTRLMFGRALSDYDSLLELILREAIMWLKVILFYSIA